MFEGAGELHDTFEVNLDRPLEERHRLAKLAEARVTSFGRILGARRFNDDLDASGTSSAPTILVEVTAPDVERRGQPRAFRHRSTVSRR